MSLKIETNHNGGNNQNNASTTFSMVAYTCIMIRSNNVLKSTTCIALKQYMFYF